MDCDILIVGGGAAGSTAAYRLANSGANVVLVSSGTPATAMSPGRITVSQESEELKKFLMEAGRPYGLFTKEEKTENFTNKGTQYQQSFLSAYDDNSAAQAAAGIKGFKDLNPELVSRILSQTGRELTPYWIEEGSMDEMAEAMQEIPADTIMIPPLFDLRHYAASMDNLEKLSGRRLREAVTPLSLPGRRLSECLLQAAKTAGAQVMTGRKVIDITAQSALVQSGIREQEITYSALLLAGGNLVSGGLSLDGNLVREPLLGINVTEINTPRLHSAALTEALSSGICAHGCRAAAGVYACGSIVAGLSYPLSKGLWDVMLSAWKTAETIKEAAL